MTVNRASPGLPVESFLDRASAYFRAHEGVIPHMYLDVVGLVTIGIGFMIPSEKAADKLTLVRRVDSLIATRLEKASEWRVIKGLPKAKVASWYLPYTALFMSDAAIDAMLRTNLSNFTRELKRHFPMLDFYPEPARIGLLDMAYSLGTHGLVTKYPKFCAAVSERDWLKCAWESERLNVSFGRNKALANLFRSIQPKEETHVS